MNINDVKSCLGWIFALIFLDLIIIGLFWFRPELTTSLAGMILVPLLILVFIVGLGVAATYARKRQKANRDASCRTLVFILTIISVLALIVVLGLQAGQQAVQGKGQFTPLTGWVITLILLAFLGLYVGYVKNDKWLGIIIDNRNQLSLSYYQIFIWTILIVSSFFAFALMNVGSAPYLNNNTTAITPSLNNTTLAVGVLNNTATVSNTTLLAALLNSSTPLNNTTLLVGELSQVPFNKTATYVDALSISIPQDVLAILGITVATVVGKQLVEGVLKKRATDEEVTEAVKKWMLKRNVSDGDVSALMSPQTNNEAKAAPDPNATADDDKKTSKEKLPELKDFVAVLKKKVKDLKGDLSELPGYETVGAESRTCFERLEVPRLTDEDYIRTLWECTDKWEKALEPQKTEQKQTLPKDKQDAAAAHLDDIKHVLDVQKRLSKVTFDGLTVYNRDVDYALPSDIFTGDEIATWGYVDLPKIQMFLFTTILAVAYAIDIAGMLTGLSPQLKAFPNLDPIMAGFLAASNAGYLAYKGAPQSGVRPKDNTTDTEDQNDQLTEKK